MPWYYAEAPAIGPEQMKELSLRLLDEARSRLNAKLQRVLLLPPDLTRAHSGAGKVAEWLYQALPPSCDVRVIPTLGQHVPHTPEDNRWMFGSIPENRIYAHDWRRGVHRVGVVPAERVRESTGGRADWPIPIDLNRDTVMGKWDLVVHIGHVVPHEVLGFANHNKNYFIGLGGKETICASHMAAACYGIENNLGRLITPLRACYNWAEEQFLSHIPDVYFQIVMNRDAAGKLVVTGVYVGDDLETYLMAARASRMQNITVFDQPVKKIVAVMQADEFRAMWVANKAVYRTRMAMADGGELLVIAPGVERFGEQPEVDCLIRKYGYRGTQHIMEHYRRDPQLQEFAHAAAHLIHGSSEGRFTIRYAAGKLSRAEIEGVGYRYMDVHEALELYSPARMKEGWNHMPGGEEVFFIHTPSAGLWASRDRLGSDNAF